MQQAILMNWIQHLITWASMNPENSVNLCSYKEKWILTFFTTVNCYWMDFLKSNVPATKEQLYTITCHWKSRIQSFSSRSDFFVYLKFSQVHTMFSLFSKDLHKHQLYTQLTALKPRHTQLLNVLHHWSGKMLYLAKY